MSLHLRPITGPGTQGLGRQQVAPSTSLADSRHLTGSPLEVPWAGRPDLLMGLAGRGSSLWTPRLAETLWDPYTRECLLNAALKDHAGAFQVLKKKLEEPLEMTSLEILAQLVRMEQKEGTEGPAGFLLWRLETRAMRPVLARMRRNVESISLAQKDLGPPDRSVVFAHTTEVGQPTFRQWSHTRQVLVGNFPIPVRMALHQIFEECCRSGERTGERTEQGSLAILFEDGPFLLDLSDIYSSGESGQIDFYKCSAALQRGLDRIEEAFHQSSLRRDQRITLFSVHTHPQSTSQNLKADAIRVHEDGRFWTPLSRGDIVSANYFLRPARDFLRGTGFTGIVEYVECALPVPFLPLQDLEDQLYATTYTVKLGISWGIAHPKMRSGGQGPPGKVLA